MLADLFEGIALLIPLEVVVSVYYGKMVRGFVCVLVVRSYELRVKQDDFLDNKVAATKEITKVFRVNDDFHVLGIYQVDYYC